MPTTALCSLHSILLVAGPLGATLHVPADYSTIQACIDAAVSGVDECIVAPGTYNETINFLGKTITLRSSGGADVTTIDATGIGGSVVTCSSGEGTTPVLEGFTITGGTGTHDAGGFTYGGGMYSYFTSPTVVNCTFSANTASYFGGGMYNEYSNPTVTNCTFSKNTATHSGGGMFNYLGSATVTNCSFRENTGNTGGGMFSYRSSAPVTNCTFTRNTATVYGGGMFSLNSMPAVTHCAFRGNTAEYGGGIYNSPGSRSPTLTNCTFSGNTVAFDGGGMYNLAGSPTLINCTFGGNTATNVGGGMYNYDLSPTLINCILWGNGANEVVKNERSMPTIGFSDVQGGLPVGAVDGGGNINLDPMFVRPPDLGPDGEWDGVDDDYGDLRLQAGSPCIDTGDPAFVPQPGETDLDGHARVLCGRVDMGAYEFGIGDYDCDNTVGLTDFSYWSACATQPQNGPYDIGCEAFDFDADGDVDLGDLAAWQNAFTGQ